MVQTNTVSVTIEWACYLHLNLVFLPLVRVIGLSPLPKTLPIVNAGFPGAFILK